jgi:hypothetical protein
MDMWQSRGGGLLKALGGTELVIIVIKGSVRRELTGVESGASR